MNDVQKKQAIELLNQILELGEASKSVLLEEYARELIVEEEMHLDEVNKMLRRPGDIAAYNPGEG